MKHILIIGLAAASVLSAPCVPLKDAYQDDFLIGYALGACRQTSENDRIDHLSAEQVRV